MKASELDKTIVSNIVNILKCDRDDIKNIDFIKIGLTNTSFKFVVKGKEYIYRHPGENTKLFINRKSEIYSERIAKDLGLNKTLIHIDEKGWKLSKYISNPSYIDPYNIEDQKKAMKLIKKLHSSLVISPYNFDYMKETNKFIKLFKKTKLVNFKKYESIHLDMEKINRKLNKFGINKVLCHNDYWFYNILKDKNSRLSLIDWEYSGNSYPACDVAYFISSLDFNNDDYLKLARLYEEHKLSDEEVFYYEAALAITMWYWYVWALYKEATGKTIEDKEMWYEKAINALRIAKEYKC